MKTVQRIFLTNLHFQKIIDKIDAVDAQTSNNLDFP